MLKDYFLKYHTADLTEILNAPNDKVHVHTVHVNFITLFEHDIESAQNILHLPRTYLPLCDEGLREAQEALVTSEQSVKKRVRTRITAVPTKIEEGQIGELVSANGIVVRMSQPKILQVTKNFSCRKCKGITKVDLEMERLVFPEVKKCKACHSKSMSPSTEHDDYSNYQEIKIQEKCETNSSGAYSTGLQVILLDDLINRCKPGDNIDISGILIRRWGPVKEGQWVVAMPYLFANNVLLHKEVSDVAFSSQETAEIFENFWDKHRSDPLVGRDKILQSICPQLSGMYLVKLAVAVVLAGGVPKASLSGSRVRGEPHLLLIGDPGTGKSQLLHTAARLAVRSVFTTGIGSTAAGLTAAAVKDGDGWHLEAGALVLADGGICCVDEFTTMTSHDRASVHEAMEQQTVSIAKAGLVSVLNSRCSVIAAINPEGGRFVDNEEWKTRLGTPLLSRFDLILLLKDKRNAEWDELTADHVLKAACKGDENSTHSILGNQGDFLNIDNLWKEELLQKYFSRIHLLQPRLTKEAQQLLSGTYLYHRSHPERRAERTTVRLLDSLVRLAEGHARLMYRTQVEVIDAVIAADLINTLTDTTELGSPFPIDPMSIYRSRGQRLLTLLGLNDYQALL